MFQVAGLWALTLGFWPVLAAVAATGGRSWLWRELCRDFDPVRRWLFLLPPPAPVPVKYTFLYPV